MTNKQVFFNDLINNSNNINNLSLYIENNYLEIYNFFTNHSYNIKEDLQQYFSKNQRIIENLNYNKKMNSNFLFLIYDNCIRYDLKTEFNVLYDLALKYKISIPTKVKIVQKFNCLKRHIDLVEFIDNEIYFLEKSYNNDGESINEITYILIQFYLKSMQNNMYNPSNAIEINNKFKFILNANKYYFDNVYIDKILQLNLNEIEAIKCLQSEYLLKDIKKDCVLESYDIKAETGNYRQKLLSIEDINTRKVQKFCKDYCVANLQDEDEEIFNSLDRGKAILQNELQLYKYFYSFGFKHILKLENCFLKIKNLINNKKINIIDYGCGQALASICLIDYIKENNINSKIENISLIEPSKIALSRGMLHINVFDDNINIKSINKSLNELNNNDLSFNNNNLTIHLFSNILDVESVNLDEEFFKNYLPLKNEHCFICVSPNYGFLRNAKLELIYNYFTKIYNSQLLSKCNDDILYGNNKTATRYEIIFKVET